MAALRRTDSFRSSEKVSRWPRWRVASRGAPAVRWFLGYDAEDLDRLEGGHLAREGLDTITVLAGQTAWTVRPSPQEIVVDDGASDRPRVVIQAAPDAMLLRFLDLLEKASVHLVLVAQIVIRHKKADLDPSPADILLWAVGEE